jgi:hypothetical protein
MPWRAAVLVLVTLALSQPAAAHPVPFSYLDLHVQKETTRLDGSVIVHVIDVAHDLDIVPPERLLTGDFAGSERTRITELLQQRLKLEADGRPLTLSWRDLQVVDDRQGLRFTFSAPLQSTPGSLAVSCAMFPYDPNHQTFLNIYEGGTLVHQAILDRSRTAAEFFTGTRQGALAVVARFLPSGIHHILIGPDHILFLFGLLLLGGTMRQLLVIVTAFTVAHSVTLSLAALAIVSPPARIIEPAIALSIIYVGADNLLMQGGRDMRPWIALAFGFIHGFGFANVLREMDLPSRALGWSLFAFNLGVEVGQVVIVTLVASCLAAVRAHNALVARRLVLAGSIVVMCAGAFWFVERVFFPA